MSLQLPSGLPSAPPPPPPERSLGIAIAALLSFGLLLPIAPALVSTGFANSVGAGPYVARIEEPRISDGKLVVAFKVGNQGSVAGAATCEIKSGRPGEAGLSEIITTEQIAPGEIIEERRILHEFDGTLRPLSMSCGMRPWEAATTINLNPTPAPTPTPVPTEVPEGETPAPTEAPSEGGSSAGGFTIVAMGVAFDLSELRVPADTVIELLFDNQDGGIPHNVAIHDGSATAVGAERWQGAIFPGVATQTYEVPAIPAGRYAFICTVHPNMVGDWIVE